jgi:hypothetical protein
VVTRGRLALGAVPIPTRIISHHLVRASVTLFDMSAQSSSTAGADVAESFPLLL